MRYLIYIISFCLGACLPLSLAFAFPLEKKTEATYAYMVDAQTGSVLLDKQSQQSMNPSSMSKLMTLYVLFEELQSGRLTLDQQLPVSEKAWRMGGSKMFVHMDQPVTVEQLIRGISVQSGNDACIVVAEALAGSEEAFAYRLNQTAKRLGLESSHFVNATGWPHPEHMMSSRDIVTLAIALIKDFPEYYHYLAEQKFSYNGITQRNRNRLLGGTLGVDGLKTGHTEIAGYGIALSAKDSNHGRRLVLVINGLESDAARISEGTSLLSYGLNAFENKKIVSKGAVAGSLPVWFGAKENVEMVVSEDLTTTLLKGDKEPFKAEIKALLPLKAPITSGDQVATLFVTHHANTFEIPLLARHDIQQATGLEWIHAFFTQYLTHGR